MYALECGDYADILSWTQDRLSFKIENPALFEEKVLPSIFKDAKFSSFQRKVSPRGLFVIMGQKTTHTLLWVPTMT